LNRFEGVACALCMLCLHCALRQCCTHAVEQLDENVCLPSANAAPCAQGAQAAAPEVAAESARALAACEALLHPRAPPAPVPLPPAAAPAATRGLDGAAASGPAQDALGTSAGFGRAAGGSAVPAYLGVPRMWSAVAAWEGLTPMPDPGMAQALLGGPAASAAPAEAGRAAAEVAGNMDVDEAGSLEEPEQPAPGAAAPPAAPPPGQPPAAVIAQAAGARRASEAAADYLSLDVPLGVADPAATLTPQADAAAGGRAAPGAGSAPAEPAPAGAPAQRPDAAHARPGLSAVPDTALPPAAPGAARATGKKAQPGVWPGPGRSGIVELSAPTAKPAAPSLGLGLGEGESEDSEGSLPAIDSGLSSSDEESGIEE